MHKKAVRSLRSTVDILMQTERDAPAGFATTGMIFPAVLAGLREKTKRPIDVLLRPDGLTWHQRHEVIRTIDDELRRMNSVSTESPADDAALYTCVCLDWMRTLHLAYFRAADMPDVLPEMTIQVRDDISDLLFRALDHGSSQLDSLQTFPEESATQH